MKPRSRCEEISTKKAQESHEEQSFFLFSLSSMYIFSQMEKSIEVCKTKVRLLLMQTRFRRIRAFETKNNNRAFLIFFVLFPVV